MSDVRIEPMSEQIAQALKELKMAIITQNHILDGLDLKQQELMRIALDELKLPKPVEGDKRSVRFDVDKKQIVIEDKRQLIT